MSRNIIVIPFNLPWEWSTDYTNQTAFVLGKNNIVICYMWSDYLSLKEYFVRKRLPILIKRYSKNIYLFYPILLIPFRRFDVIVKWNEWLNILILKLFIKLLTFGKAIRKKVLWLFDPMTRPLIQYFDKSWLTIYDCVDYFIGTSTNKSQRMAISQNEIALVKSVDFATANSLVLQKHLLKIRKDVALVPQGFRIDTFTGYKASKETPILKRGKRPLIGFVGAVNYRIDYKLLYTLAIRHKEWDFAIWGPELQVDQMSDDQKNYLGLLKNLPNLIFGKSDKKEIPGIVGQFDIGMIPYIPDDDFNKYCYPMKLFEFFYVGIPVISIEIEELKKFPDLVKVESSPKGWEGAIKEILSKKWPTNKINKEKTLAIDNSWDEKIRQILEVSGLSVF